MEHIFQHGLSNAALAAVLAILAAIAARIWRNPYFAYAAWLIVLVRLVAPPLVPVSVPLPGWSALANHNDTRITGATAPEKAGNPVNLSAKRSGGLGATPTALRGRAKAFDSRAVLKPEHETAMPPQPSRADKSPTPEPRRYVAPPDIRGAEPIARREESEANGSKHSAIEAQSTKNATEMKQLASGDSTIGRFARISVVPMLAVVWLSGTVCYLLLVGVRAVRFSRALRSGRREVPESLRAEAVAAAATVGLRRTPRMAILAAPLPPFVWPGWRPTILLPQALITSLGISQRRLLLLHEFVHLRRLDHRVRWFQLGVVALYWWNPIAWWAARRLERAEEECCDAAVLRLEPDQADGYGKTLVAVTEFLSTGKLPAPAFSIGIVRENHLKRRLHMILNGPRWPSLSKTRIAACAIAGISLLAVTWRAVTAQNEPAPSPPSARIPVVRKVQPVEKPIDPRLAPLLKREPFKPEPHDDERRTQFKAQYNSVLGKVLRDQQELQKGSAGAVARLCETVPQLFETELALVTTDDEKVQILESHVDYCHRIWMVANARLKERLPGVDRADESRARQARFAAETRLNELHAAIDAAANDKTNREHASSQADEPLVAAMLKLEDLKPEPGDDDMQKLMKERYNAALRSVRLYQYQYDAGTARGAGVIGALRELAESELALVKLPADQIRILEQHLKKCTELWKEAEAKLIAGGVTGFTPVDESDARAARYEAEVRLLRLRAGQTNAARAPAPERGAVSPGPSGSVARSDGAVSFAGLAPDESGPSNRNGKSLADLANFSDQRPQPGENPPRKQLKERYNDALRMLKSRVNRFEHGKTSAKLLCDAAREFTDARLALFADPLERVPIANWYSVFAVMAWREAEAKLHAGGNTRENREDEAAARAAISDARSKYGTVIAAFPALMSSNAAEISPNDDERHKLLIERFNAALRHFRAAYSRWRVLSIPFGDVIVAARELGTADVARSRSGDVVAAHERDLELLQYLEKLAESIRKNRGPIGPDDVETAHAARLEAELQLLDAKQAAVNQNQPSTQSSAVPPASGTNQPGKALPRLLTAKPLEIAAKDNERTRLLKQRYNAALGSLQWSYKRREIDTSPALSLTNVIEAGRQVFAAEVALAKPQDGLAAYEKYFELMKFLEQKAETELKTRVGRDELDAAHAARLDAEIKLLDARQAGAGQQPPSAHATAEAPRSVETTPWPGDMLLQPAASHPRSLPALLTAEPLQIAPGDDARKKLLTERYNAALRSLKTSYERQKVDPSVTFTDVLAAARQVLAADAALHKSGATYERYFELMKFLDQTVTSMRKSRVVDPATYAAVHEARLDAEVKLLDVRGGNWPFP